MRIPEMILDWVMIAGGLALLVFGGDALVKGAVNLSLRLGIPPLIVGLTVVAFGTSAPELLVSVQAALAGQAGIALGNVIGSNIANVLLILGLPALLVTIHTSASDTTRSYWVMMATSVLFIGLCFTGPLVWWHGLVLLTGLVLMLGDNIRLSLAHKAADDADLDGVDAFMPLWRIVLYIVLGLIGLAVGARFLVDGASNVARAFGVSETVIGLTLVALGTSLPELVTSVIAALRRNADMAMGNVIGSNIFNILSIIGITALIAPLEVPEELLRYDLWVMLAVALVLLPFAVMRRNITRWVGIVFVAAYVAYTVSLVA